VDEDKVAENMATVLCTMSCNSAYFAVSFLYAYASFELYLT